MTRPATKSGAIRIRKSWRPFGKSSDDRIRVATTYATAPAGKDRMSSTVGRDRIRRS